MCAFSIYFMNRISSVSFDKIRKILGKVHRLNSSQFRKINLFAQKCFLPTKEGKSFLFGRLSISYLSIFNSSLFSQQKLKIKICHA